MAILRNVDKTDTLETQRQKINLIAQDVFTVQSSVGEGGFSFSDGSVTSPSLFFTTQPSLGMYKSAAGTITVASTNKNVISFSDTRVVALKPFSLRSNAIGNLGAGSVLSITNSGSNYIAGTYNGISLTGGTGSGATANIVITGFGGSVTNEGSGYTPGTYSNVSLTGGSGTGATANITIQDITGTVSGGSGYTNGTYSNVPLTGGSGTGAQATIQVSGGSIASVVISNSGNKAYVNGNVLSASSANIGGTGSGFTFTINNYPFKIRTANIAFTSFGSNYVSGNTLGVSAASVGGTGSGFAYTISSVGTLSSIQLVNGGNSYSLNDSLSFNPNDLAASETYTVTVANTQLLVFGGTLPTTGFTVGSTVTIGSNTKTILKRYTSGSNITAVIVDTSGGTFSAPNSQTATSSVGGATATVSSNTVANQYFFNLNDGNGAQLTPNITLLKNKTYVFSGAEFASHPFAFSTTADGTHGGGTQYTGSEVITTQTTVSIKPNASTPSTLYIYCTNHPNMAGYDGREMTVTIGSDYVAPGSGAAIRVDSILDSDSFAVTLGGNVTAANITGSAITGTSLSITGPSNLTGSLSVTEDANFSRNINLSKSSNIDESLNLQKYFIVNPTKITGTGTISCLETSTTVSGFSTTFLSQIEPGDQLYTSTGRYIGVVDGVNNNTTIILEDNAALTLTPQAFKYARDPQIFSDYKTGFVGIYNSVPEYNLDITGTFRSSNNSVIGSSIDAKVAIGSQSLLSGLSSSDKLIVQGNIIGSDRIIASSTSDLKNPTISFSNNLKSGISSDSTNKTLSITGLSGELTKFESEKVEIYRNTNFISTSVNTFTINPGSGYTNGNYLNVLLAGGTGSGIYGNITVGFATNITQPGTGYTNGTYTGVPLTGGSGTGAQATIVISSGSVYNISVTNGGSGYETAPSVSISGTGTGATAVANLSSSGNLKSIGVNSGGSGYTSPPSVIIGSQWTASNTVSVGQQFFYGSNLYTVTVAGVTGTNPPTHTTGSATNGTTTLTYAGNVATATATVGSTPGVDVGTIIGIGITSAGSGYTVKPNISFSGGGGAGATASAVLQFTVSSVTITNPGSNYSTAPSVSFSSLSGNGAVANSSITNTGVSSVTVTNAGTGYQVGNTLSFSHTTLLNSQGQPSTAPTTAASLTISSLGTVNVVTIVDEGNGYIAGDVLTLPSTTGLNTGSGFTYTINSITKQETVKIDKKLGSITANYINTIGSGILIDNNLSIDGTTISSTQNEDIVISPGSSSRLLSISGTGGVKIPVGNSTNRPAATTAGIIRYNTVTSQYEGSNGVNFISLGGVRDVDGNTYIIAEETVGANDNILYFFNDGYNSARLSRTELELTTANKISSKDTDGKFAWKANTAYLLNAYVYYGDNIYRVTTAGTTSTVAPTHTSGSVTDGTAVLQYYSDAYANLEIRADEVKVGIRLNVNDKLSLYSYNTNNLIFENQISDFQFAFGNVLGVPDTFFTIDTAGSLKINRTYDTGAAVDNQIVLDKTLKFIEIDDLLIQTADLSLVKGTNNTGTVLVYNPTTHKGAKIVVVADNLTTGDKHIVEYNVIHKNTDIYVNEYGNLDTGTEQFSVVFDFDGSGNVRSQFTLTTAVATGNNVVITTTKTQIKK